MRILQVVKTNTGASWAYTQANWLFENGVDIITILPTINGGMAEEYKKSGMKILEGDFTLPIKKPWLLLKRTRDINSLIKELEPDIIHCHFVTNIMMFRLALRKSNIPRLFQVPGPLHLESSFFKNIELILSMKNDFWAAACKKTYKIYTNSQKARERVFLAYYGGYGGKTCNEYMNSKNILHKEYAISNDKILVGMVSYFYKPKKYLLQTRGLKGHEDFIDAIALVRKKNPFVIGVIIGGAWGNSTRYEEKVKKYANKMCKDGIIFTGFRSDLKKIYRELDVAVHPSHSENLGGAAESLAAGVPTISTNVGGFPDIVINSKTGYTVFPRSSEELANSIIRLIQDPISAREMGESGKKLVYKLLDIDNTASNMLTIYKDIMNKPNKNLN